MLDFRTRIFRLRDRKKIKAIYNEFLIDQNYLESALFLPLATNSTKKLLVIRIRRIGVLERSLCQLAHAIYPKSTTARANLPVVLCRLLRSFGNVAFVLEPSARAMIARMEHCPPACVNFAKATRAR